MSALARQRLTLTPRQELLLKRAYSTGKVEPPCDPKKRPFGPLALWLNDCAGLHAKGLTSKTGVLTRIGTIFAAGLVYLNSSQKGL